MGLNASTYRRRHLMPLVVAAALLGLLAACGGGEDPTPTATQSTGGGQTPTATQPEGGETPTQPETSFFEGKRGTMVIGYTPGGTYDFWGRLFATHMPKYIPGEPSFTPEERSGAGSLIAANYLYNQAEADGLTIGVIGRTLPFPQLLGDEGVQYEWQNFSFLGTPETTFNVFYINADTGITTFEDLLNSDQVVQCGAQRPGTDTFWTMARTVEVFFGANVEIVTGYPGGNEISLAVDRGEIDCGGQSGSAYLTREPFLTWEQEGSANVLFHTSREPIPELPGVPSIFDLADEVGLTQQDRQLLTVLNSEGQFGRPFVAPPGVPEDRLAILRDAFAQATEDPEFIAAAEQRGVPITPVLGEEMQGLAQEVMNVDDAMLQRLDEFLFPSE